MDFGERVARLESGQEWTKLILGLIGAVMIGGFAFLGIQIGRLDAKVDTLGARISAESAATRQEIDALSARITSEGAATRQELIGIANAISSSITAARQIQPQVIVVPMPTPSPQPTPPAKP